MADRTWNRIDMTLFDEDLSVEALFVYILLKAKCPNRYGIYPIPTGFIKRKMTAVVTNNFSLEPILDELQSQNKIRLYSDTVWIISQFKEDPTKCIKRNIRAMFKFFAVQQPDLQNDFKSHYSEHFANPPKMRRTRTVIEA